MLLLIICSGKNIFSSYIHVIVNIKHKTIRLWALNVSEKIAKIQYKSTIINSTGILPATVQNSNMNLKVLNKNKKLGFN